MSGRLHEATVTQISVKSLLTSHFMNMAMVVFMKKIRFVAMLTVMSLLFFGPYRIAPASAVDSTNPSSSSSSIDPSSPASTSLSGVMPAAHSAGANSFLTINDAVRKSTVWTACTFAEQEYCYESLTVINSEGLIVGSPTSLIRPYANCHGSGNGGSLDPAVLNPPCSLSGEDWMEMQLWGTLSKNDLSNTYRWKVRTGKISPDILMMGEVQKTKVEGNDNDGWSIEIWAKPALWAQLNGFTPNMVNAVAERAEIKIQGYARELRIGEGPQSVVSEDLRKALRGTFISSNGMTSTWDFSSDTFFVTAMGPHFLPQDSTGKSEVTPGFVRVFLPESYITLDRGYENLSLITPERIKLTVSGQNATAKVTKVEGGILVDTGVEHFSAPNPQVKVLKASEVAIPVVTYPTVLASTLNKGASKTLSSIAKTKASQKPKWIASGKCKIVGSKVVALKVAGTCKVTLRVLNSKKKYVVQTTKTFKVS